MRFAPTLAAAALAAAGLTFIPGSAQAAPNAPKPEAKAAATWLAGTIGEDGLIPGGGLDGYFYSANLDFGISLAATGQAPSAALTKLRAGVDATISQYIGDVNDISNAAKVAKAAYFYSVTGGGSSDAGEDRLNLASALAADVDDVSGQLGSTDSAYGQVWAVMALAALGNPEALKARDFLIDENGPDADDGWGYVDTFSDPENPTFVSDPDATSWAIKALSPWKDDEVVADAIADGVSYLQSLQDEAGGIDAGYLGVNANSTGAAAAAFAAAGETDSAVAAATWLADHQIVSLPLCGAKAANAGAIAYNDDDLAAGVSTDNIEQSSTATAQAIEGLAFLPARTPAISAPTGFVRAGSDVEVKVSGLRESQSACLSGGTEAQDVLGSDVYTVTTPAGTAVRTVTLSTVGGTTTAKLHVLGAAKLKVSGAKKVKRGKKLTVTVKGLVAGEQVTVKLGRTTLGKAKANAAGNAVLRAKVAKKTTTGKKTLVVTGAFANRVGASSVKVTR